jgi:hypothetical protein
MSDDANSLTGIWNGLFTQAGSAPISFLATLIETGESLSGSTREPCMIPGCPRKTHDAVLSGRRHGSAVAFTKTYDPPGWGYDHVEYEGTLNADATEIDGRWVVPGLSGKFLMIRSGGMKTAQTNSVLERA